ncbi:guanylate kinase [Candidatus Omnitrophota bacterium]
MNKKNLQTPSLLKIGQAWKRKPGTLFVVSGPSGCGKTTLCDRLLKRGLRLDESISATTRKPRKNEKQGQDYIFVDDKVFKKGIQENQFLEYAKVFGKYYGTPKKNISSAIKKNKDVLLNIDVKGASQIRRLFNEAVLIFIMPPTFSELERRLRKRSADTKTQIAQRLQIARQELRSINIYDYLVVNDNIKEAVGEIVAIIIATRCKTKKKGA